MLKFTINKNDDMSNYEELSSDENGLNKLKIGSYIKYKYYNKYKSGGFLVMIKKSPLKNVKELNILVLKNGYHYIELPFFKYTFYQKINNNRKSIFNSKEERENIILNGKTKLLEIIKKKNI
jgi:hypothetical protein